MVPKDEKNFFAEGNYNPRLRGAAIAQWIRLRLPSCRPRFESQAHHLRFFQFILFKLYICHLNWSVKRTKIKEKEAGIGPLKKTIILALTTKRKRR